MREMERLLQLTDQERRYLRSGDGILDITASGRYWRSSKLERICLVHASLGDDSGWSEHIWEMEQEADEYDMLLLLSDALKSVKTVITFNGHSFDLPHLQHKYEAYGLEDPFHGKEYRDLYLEYKELYVLLGLPSRKLADYAVFLKLDPDVDDAVRTAKLLTLDSVMLFLEGSWELVSAKRETDHLYYELRTEEAFPVRMSFHDEIYHLILEDHSARLSVQMIENGIRRYYTDVKQYVYLPLEGYAIHKSMAGYVAKEHKEKAVRSNCFSITSYSDRFLTDEKWIRSYLITALLFLQTR